LQSRIIRDLQTLDHTGVGKSRGFGFVEFKNHQDAIKAVAAVNNNATIFKSEKVKMLESTFLRFLFSHCFPLSASYSRIRFGKQGGAAEKTEASR
jgi:RNA recognition motif-containing protein